MTIESTTDPRAQYAIYNQEDLEHVSPHTVFSASYTDGTQFAHRKDSNHYYESINQGSYSEVGPETLPGNVRNEVEARAAAVAPLSHAQMSSNPIGNANYGGPSRITPYIPEEGIQSLSSSNYPDWSNPDWKQQADANKRNDPDYVSAGPPRTTITSLSSEEKAGQSYYYIGNVVNAAQAGNSEAKYGLAHLVSPSPVDARLQHESDASSQTYTAQGVPYHPKYGGLYRAEETPAAQGLHGPDTTAEARMAAYGTPLQSSVLPSHKISPTAESHRAAGHLFTPGYMLTDPQNGNYNLYERAEQERQELHDKAGIYRAYDSHVSYGTSDSGTDSSMQLHNVTSGITRGIAPGFVARTESTYSKYLDSSDAPTESHTSAGGYRG